MKLTAELFQLTKRESMLEQEDSPNEKTEEKLTEISLAIDEKAHAVNKLIGLLKYHLQDYKENERIENGSPNVMLAEYLETAYAQAQHYLDFICNPQAQQTWKVPASAGAWTSKKPPAAEPSPLTTWQELMARRVAGKSAPSKEDLARASQANGANGVEARGKGRD